MVSLAKRLRAAWRAFEGGQASPQHLARPPTMDQSPDAAVELAGRNLQAHGRFYDENHDLAIGIHDDLVTNIVGTGIVLDPQPRLGGQVNENIADAILDAWAEWGRAPEVTGELPMGELQRVTCRAWMVTGEFFAQHVGANTPYPFGESVRYRVEFLDADMIPMDESGVEMADRNPRERQGVIHDDWNRPVAYRVFLKHPNDFVFGADMTRETKIVPAERILHCKFVRRWPQTRGVPITHGIIRRLADLKDYEDSERIAARVAASMCAFIRKSPDVDVPTDVSQNFSAEREQRIAAGRIFDMLLPGEEIGTIDTNRPTSELGAFRTSQVQALAAGTGTRYSSISRDYRGGSYASQRQEMVESRPHYLRLRNYYIERFLRPVYETWLRQAWLQGALEGVPNTIAFDDLKRADFIGPGMPWIDPLKEVQADVIAVNEGFKTRDQIIRQRGDDPRAVRDALRQPAPEMTVVEDDDETDTDQSRA